VRQGFAICWPRILAHATKAMRLNKAMRLQLDDIKVLAVDLIGTLAKKVGMTFAIRASEYLAENGYDISPAKFRTLYRKRDLEYSMGNYASEGEFYEALSADLSNEGPQPWLEALTDMRIQCSPAFDDAQPFLEQASRTHRLILSSNYIGPWARRMLVNNHWEEYFQALVVSSECRFRKPSRHFFLELLKVSGVKSPAEILVIGDSLTDDVYGAARVGLQTVLMDRNAEARKRELPKTVPSVQSLDELLQGLTGESFVAT
jgi:HAD superfamily hydrolase (TIGR01549 family)